MFYRYTVNKHIYILHYLLPNTNLCFIHFNLITYAFQEQVQWAIEEGADFIIGETYTSFGEAKIALEMIKEVDPSIAYNQCYQVVCSKNDVKHYDNLLFDHVHATDD